MRSFRKRSLLLALGGVCLVFIVLLFTLTVGNNGNVQIEIPLDAVSTQGDWYRFKVPLKGMPKKAIRFGSGDFTWSAACEIGESGRVQTPKTSRLVLDENERTATFSLDLPSAPEWESWTARIEGTHVQQLSLFGVKVINRTNRYFWSGPTITNGTNKAP